MRLEVTFCHLSGLLHRLPSLINGFDRLHPSLPLGLLWLVVCNDTSARVDACTHTCQREREREREIVQQARSACLLLGRSIERSPGAGVEVVGQDQRRWGKKSQWLGFETGTVGTAGVLSVPIVEQRTSRRKNPKFRTHARGKCSVASGADAAGVSSGPRGQAGKQALASTIKPVAPPSEHGLALGHGDLVPA